MREFSSSACSEAIYNLCVRPLDGERESGAAAADAARHRRREMAGEQHGAAVGMALDQRGARSRRLGGVGAEARGEPRVGQFPGRVHHVAV